MPFIIIIIIIILSSLALTEYLQPQGYPERMTR